VHGSQRDAGTCRSDVVPVVLALSAVGLAPPPAGFPDRPGPRARSGPIRVVCVDALGNGLTSSPVNSQRQPGAAFPRFSICATWSRVAGGDCSSLRRRSAAAVVGASMGGMQALQWAVSHPARVGAIVAMTPMARTAPWAVAIVEASRLALMADPAWDGERFTAVPTRGWRAWSALMGVLASRTPAALAGRFDGPRQVVDWMEALAAERLADDFDAADWICQSRAYEAHDVGATPGFEGDTAAALGSIRARTLVLAPPLDLFNPADEADLIAAAIPGARRVVIPSVQGHQAAGTASPEDSEFLNAEIGAFLGAFD
jgi:homoserine O-acetyltransferase/O-succinyltransferase